MPGGYFHLPGENSLRDNIIRYSKCLPKYFPRYQTHYQRRASPDQIQTVSQLVRRYTYAGYNLSRRMRGEYLLHFVVKYMLDADLIPLLMSNGADCSAVDKWDSTPIEVALMNLPASKRIVSTLLRQKAPVYIHQEDGDDNALFLLCSRSPDDDTADLINLLLTRQDVWTCDYDRQCHIKYESVHKAIEHHAPVCVLEALMDNGCSHHYGPAGMISTVGRAVQEGQPDALAYLIGCGAFMSGRGGYEINPVFNCVNLAKSRCPRDADLVEILCDPHLRCLKRLLRSGAVVTISTYRSISPLHEYWSFPESQEKRFTKPDTRTFSPFVCLYDINPDREHKLTSYAVHPVRPNPYMMVIIFELLIRAGAIPHRGEIPHDILGSLYKDYVQTDDNTLKEALEALWELMMLAGFDLYIDECFADQLAEFGRSLTPARALPPRLERVLSQAQELYHAPHTPEHVATVRERTKLALQLQDPGGCFRPHNVSFARLVDAVATTPGQKEQKDRVKLSGVRSARSILAEKAAQMCE